MKSGVFAAAFVVAALAGCIGGDDHLHGGDFTCPDGTVVSAGNFTDHHNATFNLAGQCPEEPQLDPLPASARLVGVPATTRTYTPLNLEWVLDSDEDAPHAMLTEVRIADASAAADRDTKPEGYGDSIGKHEHRNFASGDAFNITWIPDVPGTFYLRAYAQVFGANIWTDEVTIIVEPVEPTGTTVTITIGQGGPVLASTSPAEADLMLGDAFVFQNDDLADHTITWTGGPVTLDDFTVAAGAPSDAVVLLVPGTYSYTSDDINPFSGTITVSG